MADTYNPKKTKLLHLLFILTCAGILLFLYLAPRETTHRLPHDADHDRFFDMGKKEAEKFCETCHNPNGQAPLPDKHPPKYRCLFCHKYK
ncbi:MAG: hypothetical protein AUK28_00675 [Desulfobacterales bacterium CG2_30_60_27]|nr:MAG: hypothetical protein AUK28_00675 [Desulfobacterales bacterium CG2_30_60_27]